MAHCAITPEGHIALLKKVVLFVKYNMSKGQPIDVKQLTQQFYDGLLTTFTKKHANAELAEIQALDYARFVPDYIHKIAAQDSEVLEYLIKSGVDFNTLSVDLLKLKNDATLTEIKNYLNTQDDINTVLTALNKGVSINAGPLEDEEDTLGKGEGIEDSSEAVKDIEKVVAESSPGKWRITPVAGQFAEVIYSKSTKPKYKYFLNFKIGYETNVGPAYGEDGGILDEEIIRRLAIDPETGKPTKRVFVKVGSVREEFDRYAFKFRLATTKETKQLLDEINARDLQRKKVTAAEQVVKKETAKIEEELNKNKPNQYNENDFDYIAMDTFIDFVQHFQAVAGTLLSDWPAEAPYIDPKTGKTVGRALGDNRIPIEQTKPFYAVKRTLIQLMHKLALRDSSKVKNAGQNGYFLTGMAVQTARDEYNISIPDSYKPTDIIMLLTNGAGKPIHFKENGDAVSKLKDGKPAYVIMRDLSNIYYPNGTLNEDSVRRMAAASASYRTGKALKDILPEDLAIARAHLLKEAEFLDKMRNYILKKGTTNTLEFKITNGSLGYIHIDNNYNKLTPMSELNENYPDLKIEIPETNGPKKRKGFGYVTSSELYGTWIPIEKPGIPEAGIEDMILDLLTEDVKTPLGESLTYEQRREYLRSYIDLGVTPKDKKTIAKRIILDSVTDKPEDYVLIVDKKLMKLSTPEEKALAKEELKKIFGQRYKSGFYKYQVNLPKAPIATQFIIEPVITTNENNQKIITTKQTSLYTFLRDYNFKIQTRDIAADGKLRRVSAYFIFELSDKGKDTLYGTHEEKVQELETKAKEIKEEIKIQNAQTPTNILEKTAHLSDNPAFAKIKAKGDIKDAKSGRLNKNLNQKFLNDDVTEQHLIEAEKWYENSPLNKWIPFKAMFDKVNAVDSNSVAEFNESGIILYKGSDYSDLYHEAWHGFSQMFLTIDQKIALYKEVKTKSGSFKDYNGQYVSFRDAGPKQIEEYLAEEFRKYMLSGQKPSPNSPKQNSLFRRIWNVLKILFSNADSREILIDAQADAKVRELFEKLKVGNIKEYSYSVENAMFAQLNQGITAKDKPKEGSDQLNYQDSNMVVEMLNKMLVEYVHINNANLSQDDYIRKNYLESIPEESRSEEEKAALAVLNEPRKYGFATKLLNDEKFLIEAYTYAKWVFEQIQSSKKAALDDAFNKIYELSGTKPLPVGSTTEEKTAQAIKIYKTLDEKILSPEDKALIHPDNVTLLQKDVALMSFVVDHFGDLRSIEANKPTTPGVLTDVIGYHIAKTGLFADQKIQQTFEELSETDANLNGRSFERKGNEVSLRELAKEEIIFLLETLPKYDKQGKVVINRFGIKETASFAGTWNRIVRGLQNTMDIEDMYKKLIKLSEEYKPLEDFLKIMGNPYELKALEEQSLWSQFRQAFCKTRVPLIQLTITEKIFQDSASYTTTVGEVFNADKAVGIRWNDDFRLAIYPPSSYIKRDDKGNYLDANKLLEDISLTDAIENPLRFYRAIGFNFSDVSEIIKRITDYPKTYSPTEFYKKIQGLSQIANPVRIDSLDVIIDENKKLKLQSLRTRYTDLLRLEGMYSDVISSFRVTNAEGNSQYEHMLNNTMTILTNDINNLKDIKNDKDEVIVSAYAQLLATPHLSHLDINEYETNAIGQIVGGLNPNYNPEADSSIVLRSIFHLEESDRGTNNWGRKRTHKGKDVEINVVNLSGVLLKGEKDETGEGIAAASADPYAKLALDIHLALAGYSELMRHADKSTSFGYSITGPLVGHAGPKGSVNQNFISIDKFGRKDYKQAIVDRTLPHIIGEMKRIQKLKRLAKEGVENFDFFYLKEGQKFLMFDDVLIESKKALMKLIDSGQPITRKLIESNIELFTTVTTDIQNYFEVEYKKLNKTFKEAPFLSDTLLNTVGDKVPEGMEREAILRFHVYNNWIYNAESIALFYGSIATYKHQKEDLHKRNASVASTGNTYRTDNIMKDMVNTILYTSSYAAANAYRLGIKEPFTFNGQLRTAVVADVNIPSVYAKKYAELFGEKIGKKYAKKYDEADGQGYITIDAYRQLKYAEGTWSPEHEALYQQMIKDPDKNLNPKDVTKFFPVLKAQYYGPVVTAYGSVTALHKFSLMPMIPTLMQDANMKDLHDRMIKENISYVTFQSGSKIGTITKDGTPDKLYEPGTHNLVPEIKKNLSDPFTKDIKPYFTPNIIHLQYLKNQLEIHDTYQKTTVFSTQLRKLVTIGLMANGVPTDFKENTIINNINSTTPIADNIYPQFEHKTESTHIVLPGKGDLKDVKYEGKNFWNEIVPEAKAWYENSMHPIIIAYRGNKKKTFLQNYKYGNTIGNPFDWQDEIGTQKQQGIKSTKKFLEWMITGNNFGNTNATEEYRQAIISDIKSGKWKNTTILYYAEKGYATHATVLDYLINKHNWSQPYKVETKSIQRIIKEYPNKIELPDKAGTIDTKKLLEVKKVFSNMSDESTLRDRNLGDWDEYGMTDKQYKFAKANIDLLNKIYNAVYDNIYQTTEGTLEQDTYTTFPEWVDFLLKGQERIVDTNQLDIFGEQIKPTGVVIEETPSTAGLTRVEQWRALGVYDSTGKLIDDSKMWAASRNYRLVKKFENDINKLVDIAKKDLLKEINWTSTIVNGKEKLKGDIRNLSRLVKDELKRQDVGDHGLNFIELTMNGTIKDLSSSLNVEQIEKTLNALLVKRLVNLKVTGENLIQVASTLMESLSSTVGRNYTNPTKADINKYGSNDLPFYDRDEKSGKTTAMKVKIPLANNFLHLLKAIHLDGKPIEVKGDMTASVGRLNDMLKSDEWLDKDNHREMITLTAVRIPVQSLNSMEFMEVYEFLDPGAPAIIILPTEIIIKSGSDYDIDKLNVMMPNIDLINGKPELYNSSLKTDKTEEELRKDKHEIEKRIAEVREEYSNKFLEATEDGKTFSTNEEETTIIEELGKTIKESNQSIKVLLDDLARQHKALHISNAEYLKLQKQVKTFEEAPADTTLELRKNIEQTEEQLLAAYAERDSLYDQLERYAAYFKEEFYNKKREELAPLAEERGNITRQLNSLSKKAIQNDIIQDIRAILEIPENMESLLTPNDTDLIHSYADDLAESAMDYNPLDTHDGVRRTYTVQKEDGSLETKEMISPTRVLEISYNLYKHMNNNIGKQTLGMGAVDNTYNALLNRIGAYMNPYYDVGKGTTSKRIAQTILMPHNILMVETKDGERAEAISLSHTMDANGENKISDVISQMMNGWVDVAKDSFIFNIQGNKEVSPVLLFLIQAGVPIKDAVYFVSNPLVREYVEEIRKANSILARPLGIKTLKSTDSANFIAKRNIMAKYDPEFGLEMSSKDFYKALKEYEKGIVKDIFDTNTLVERAKSKNINDTDMAVFLHFTELENMASAVSDIKRATNVDTSRDVSLFEAMDRLSMLENIREHNRLPEFIVDRLINESPIGRFFIQEFQMEFVGQLMPLRNHKVLNEYAQNAISISEGKALFGSKEKTIINWKSDLINFIFQNELRYFDIDNITHYRSLPITSDNKILGVKDVALSYGAFVKDGVLYVDKATLRTQYRNKQFKGQGYTDKGLALLPEGAIADEQEYMHFVLERETLREQRPLSSLKDSAKFKTLREEVKGKLKKETEDEESVNVAYEEYLRNEALYRIFNHYQLFKSDNTYAQEFVRIRRQYKALAEHFSLMNALAIKDGNGGYKNLSLDVSPLDREQINVFYENIYGSGNAQTSVDSLTNITSLRRLLPTTSEQELNEIVEFFKNFSIYAFLQSGMNTKGKLSLTPIISQRVTKNLLAKPLKQFKELLDEDSNLNIKLLDVYTRIFKRENKNRNHRLRGKEYYNGVSFADRTSIINFIRKSKGIDVLIPIGITETNNTYNATAVTKSNVKAIIEQNPNTVFVYNMAINTKNTSTHEDYNFQTTEGNMGIGTLMDYTSSKQVKDVNGSVNPDVKVSIDNAIKELIKLRDIDGKKIRFNSNGYGLTMIGADVQPVKIKNEATYNAERNRLGARNGNVRDTENGTVYTLQRGISKERATALETFRYLSEQLYEHFGFANPGWRETASGKQQLQKTQAITDAEITKVLKENITEFIKICKI